MKADGIVFLGYDQDGDKVWKMPDGSIVGAYDTAEEVVSAFRRHGFVGGHKNLAVYEKSFGKVEEGP